MPPISSRGVASSTSSRGPRPERSIPTCAKKVAYVAPLTVRALKSLRYLLVSDLPDAARLQLDHALTGELDRHLRTFLRYVLDRDISSTRLMDELRDMPRAAPVS